MRHVPVLIAIWLAGAASASAQVSDRLQIAAVARVDRVSFEGDQNARLPVTGVAIGYRIWSHMRIEAEVTTASGESRQSYEGAFISFAGPSATYDEFLHRRSSHAERLSTKQDPGSRPQWRWRRASLAV